VTTRRAITNWTILRRAASLWEDALQLVKSNFVIGSGFNTYEWMGRDKDFRDTHNLYMKFLVEFGITGFLLFLTLFFAFLRLGWLLYKRLRIPSSLPLDFGFSAYIICLLIVNCFGDRWNYLQISGYTWVLAGFVARGLMIEDERAAAAVAGVVHACGAYIRTLPHHLQVTGPCANDAAPMRTRTAGTTPATAAAARSSSIINPPRDETGEHPRIAANLQIIPAVAKTVHVRRQIMYAEKPNPTAERKGSGERL